MRLPARHLVTLTASLAALGLMTGCSTPAPDAELQTSSEAVTTPAETAPSAAASSAPPPSSSAAASQPADGETIVLGRDDDHTISTSGSTVSITCDGGGDISIDADEVTLQVTGACEDIEVDGDSSTVTAQDADEFDVDGDSNSLTGGVIRAITIDGESTTVSVTSTSEIDIDGSSNTVTYAEGQPQIDVDDEDANTITQG